MAKSDPATELVYHQRFQNTFKTVEVAVFAKPKGKLGIQKEKSKFMRKCLTKEKLRNLEERNIERRQTKEHNIEKNKTEDQIDKKHKGNFKPTVMKPTDELARNKIISNPTWHELLQQSQMVSKSSSLRKQKPNQQFSRSDENEDSISTEQSNSSNRITVVQKSTNFERITTRPINSGSYHGKSKENLDNRTSLIKRDCSIQCDLVKLYESDTENVEYGNEIIRPAVEAFVTDPRRPNIQKEVASSSANKNRVVGEQTHSPFGESALQLLHQLKERLRSQGNSEESDMISAIEACLSGTGNRGNYSKNKRSEDEALSSPVYPIVFETPNFEVEQLKRQLAECQERIKDQELVIQELKDLSAKLLAYHEQISVEQSSEKKANNEASSAEDENESLTQMSAENQSLQRKVKNQLEIILNLELKLASLQRELKEQRGRNGTAEVNHLKNITPAVPAVQKNPVGSSETDSAFEDKIGSRSTSRSSAVVASRVEESSVPRGSEKHLLSSFHAEDKSLSQRRLETYADKHSDPSLVTGTKNKLSALGTCNDLCSFKFADTGERSWRERSNISLSLISDLTTDASVNGKEISQHCDRNHNDPFSTMRHSDCLQLVTSDSVPGISHRYLESTHIEKVPDQLLRNVTSRMKNSVNQLDVSSSDSSESRVQVMFDTLKETTE